MHLALHAERERRPFTRTKHYEAALRERHIVPLQAEAHNEWMNALDEVAESKEGSPTMIAVRALVVVVAVLTLGACIAGRASSAWAECAWVLWATEA